MTNRFEKYAMFTWKDGKLEGVNTEAFDRANEAFELFQALYDTYYGSIEIDENLVAIHTGGWSDNEELISEFRETLWWFRYHKITAAGGHYFFNTDFTNGKKEWIINAVNI